LLQDKLQVFTVKLLFNKTNIGLAGNKTRKSAKIPTRPLERLKKYCSQFGARIFVFWRGSGEGAGLKNPVTEPKRPVRCSLGEGGSQKPKRPLS
jgi:hypothetical protein